MTIIVVEALVVWAYLSGLRKLKIFQRTCDEETRVEA